MIFNNIKKPFYSDDDDSRLALSPHMRLPQVVAVYEYAIHLDRVSYDLNQIVERIHELIPTATYPERLSVIFGYKFIPATVIVFDKRLHSYEVYLLGKPVTALYGATRCQHYFKDYPQTRMGAYWSLDKDKEIKYYIDVTERED